MQFKVGSLVVSIQWFCPRFRCVSLYSRQTKATQKIICYEKFIRFLFKTKGIEIWFSYCSQIVKYNYATNLDRFIDSKMCFYYLSCFCRSWFKHRNTGEEDTEGSSYDNWERYDGDFALVHFCNLSWIIAKICGTVTTFVNPIELNVMAAQTLYTICIPRPIQTKVLMLHRQI